MKWVSAFLLLFYSFSVHAQDVPTKGANRIIVVNSKSADENYKKIIPALLDAGYQIEKRDDEYKTVQTQARSIKGKAVNIKLNFIAKDSSIVVSGTNTSTAGLSVYSSNDPYDIEFRGMKGSEFRNAFDAMRAAAELLPGRITFEKK